MMSLQGPNYPRLSISQNRGRLKEMSQYYRGGSTNHEEMRRRCEVIDSRTMGIEVSLYHRGETSIQASILCSHGEKVCMIMKEAKEMENEMTNSKY